MLSNRTSSSRVVGVGGCHWRDWEQDCVIVLRSCSWVEWIVLVIHTITTPLIIIPLSSPGTHLPPVGSHIMMQDAE